ncbi:cytochrome P450 [Streptomyces boncukensis]|uniref:Cytochrome P450 n=1 Tax=Streptomyces boncukensis TaxID=2711219 RepID=A0A6G4X5Z2_9ACTN|nr:cytochrome P450 [Streptomyces boncukensis]NGO72959.1 cytochrome P450 [Streptomyces boncukensis]
MSKPPPQCPAAGLAPQSLEERIRRWGMHQPWLQEDLVAHWRQLRDHAPIVRSEEGGGYWILTRYADIEWAAKNPGLFSSAEAVPSGNVFPAKLIPIQYDGEEHRAWRQTLADLFNPGVAKHFTPQIRQAANDTIDSIAEKGRCEFVSEFAAVLAAESFLVVFGIGREHLRALQEHKSWLNQEGRTRVRFGVDIRPANQRMWDFFGEAVDRRRAEGARGGRDVISTLFRSSYQGRELTREEIVNILFVSMLASLDTTTSALGLIYLHLAEHPEVQEMIPAAPEKVPAITEELLRHAAVSSTGRLVTRDVERHGVTMRAGDRILLSWGLSGTDPDAFERPDEVDFERSQLRQLAFGAGPHRCLGMHIARRLIRIALEEWHRRIPRYAPAPGTAPVHHYSPARGLASLDLVAVPPPAGTGEGARW